jgi:F-type H+-transporting ATPase subunit epsilon
MLEKLLLRIITPLGTTLETKADFVVVPAVAGNLTIYPNHIPLVSVVHAGECEVSIDGVRTGYAVFSGVLDVSENDNITEVSLLVDRSEEHSSIDIGRAEEAVKRAQEIKDGLAIDHIDFARFEALIDKELNRIRIGRKYK